MLRTFLTVAVAGATLTGVYLALNPPQVERLALPDARPVARPFEWLVPVGAVTLLFAVFVVAQAGGDVRRARLPPAGRPA